MGPKTSTDLVGLQELYCPKSPKVDIVAVHGLNGHALNTWTSKKSNICWLSDKTLLPRYTEYARILSWGYNARTASFAQRPISADRILQHAQTLIQNLHADRNLKGAKDRPIVFLCHSLGGLVVKRALAYSRDQRSPKVAHLYSIYGSTYGMLFFGTPHLGSDKAALMGTLQNVGSLIFPTALFSFQNGLVNALEEHSETLQNINDQFISMLPELAVFFFWEQHPTNFRRFAKKYIVEEASAAPMLDNVERCGIAADHCDMVRFESPSSPGFTTVASALKRYCRDAPAAIEQRRYHDVQMLQIERMNIVRRLTKGCELSASMETAERLQSDLDLQERPMLVSTLTWSSAPPSNTAEIVAEDALCSDKKVLPG